MQISAYSPAPTSSITIPLPSGSCSNLRIGNGFRMSNTRKSIKPAKRDFQATGAPTKVINWPATSSMTTNCGSLRPLARATAVAAGIPMNTTRIAARIAAAASHETGIQRAMTHQSMTVAAEPQVPGPGFRRPTPKNVATSVAQSGAGGRTGVEGAGSEVAVIRGYCQAKTAGCGKFFSPLRNLAGFRRRHRWCRRRARK